MCANLEFDPAPSRSRAPIAWLLLALVLSAVLQWWFASNKGLVLDEFHSHFHATRASWSAFFETLLKDNHPPLSFLLIGGSVQLFGDGELALRLPAMGFALLEIVLLWRLVRDERLSHAGLAAFLLAASSLHLDFGTQARMYALHGTAVTGCVLFLTRLLTAKSKRLAQVGLGVGLWVGLHNHYFFLQYAGGLAAGTVFAILLVPSTRQHLRSLVAPVAVAVLCSLPWYVKGFAVQWTHNLSPGGDDVGLVALIEAYVHLFFLNVRVGAEVPLVGGFLREIFILSGALLTILAVVGAGLGLSRARPERIRISTAVVCCVAFLVPCGTVVLANILPRAGFTWHYILPSTAAMAWLIALGWNIGPALRIRRLATLFGLFAALSLSFLNAKGHGSENYPAAVANIIDQYQPGDAIVSVEWQPKLFPQGMPWDYYAPRLQSAPPERLPMVAHGFKVLDGKQLRGVPRLLLLRTSLPRDQALFKEIKAAGLSEARASDFGFGVQTLLFERN